MSNREDLDRYAARMGEFIKNQQDFPQEELMKYAGQWIAWSPDGASIVAGSRESEDALMAILENAGQDPLQFVFDYIPELDQAHVGGL